MTFEQQSYTEQVQNMTALAYEAAGAWGLNVQTLKLIAYTNNAVFYVQTPDEDYALRVRRPGHKPLAWIQSERVWMSALADNPVLRVHRPVADVYTSALRGYDGEVHCTLTTWVTGDPLPLEQLTEARLYQIGIQAAHLHRVSAAFTPPPDFIRPALDWEGLFGAEGAYHPGDGVRYFDADALALMEQATSIMRHTMQTLGTSAEVFGMIHGDLIAKNFVFDGEQAGIIDFEECAYGYYLYDLVPIIWLARGTPRAQSIADALWAGYHSIRPQPEAWRAHLDVFVMARHIASCRWIAGNAKHPNLRERVGGIIAERMQELSTYLEQTTSGAAR